MRYCDALRIHAKDVVTFVGGGGKTTAMFRLAGELAAAGRRVVVTTTTRIFAEQMRLAPARIVGEGLDAIVDRLSRSAGEPGVVLVVGDVIDRSAGTVTKAAGIPAKWVDRLIGLDGVDAVLVEGDGSRMRSFKAPAAHEPVVPANTTILVPVVGVDALGAPLTDAFVHRPERVAALAGVAQGTVITPEVVARVMTHTAGGRKSEPPTARCVPLINKVHNASQRAAAETTARLMCAEGGVDVVCIGAVADDTPIAWVARPAAGTTGFTP